MAKRQRRRRKQRRDVHAKREGLTTRQSVITGLGVTATAVLGFSAPALGANITVSNVYDPGDGTCDPIPADQQCTLREAVALANTTAAYDDIYFASSVTGTIDLDSTYGPIGITQPVHIHGPGPGTLKIDGGGNTGLFYTDMVYAGDYVTISGLHLAHGANLYGGAIDDYNSSLAVIGSVLTGNLAGVGGAVYAFNGANSPYITFSTFNGNSANYGGAIAANYSFGLIGADTFNDNQANIGGAVITGASGPFFNGYFYDSTIAGNRAYYGGGVYTFAAQSLGTILGNNVGYFNEPDVSSAYFYSYFGLVRDGGRTTIRGSQNILGADPQLFPLGNNGGPTPTMKPAAGSPVVDKSFSDADVDQRLFPRTVDNPLVANASGGDGTDIGAVELTLAEGPQPPVPPQQPPVATHKKKKCKKKKKKKHSAAAAKKKKCKKKKKKRSVSAESAARQAIGAWQAGGNGTPHRAQRAGATGHRVPIDWASQAWRFNR